MAEKCWHNQKWPLADGKKTYWLKPDGQNNEIICSIKWNCVAALIEGFYSLSWSSGISSQSFEDCIPYECILKDENWHLLSSKFYLWKHNQILYLCIHSVYLLLLDQKVITCLKFNHSSGQSKFLSLIFKFLQTSFWGVLKLYIWHSRKKERDGRESNTTFMPLMSFCEMVSFIHLFS